MSCSKQCTVIEGDLTTTSALERAVSNTAIVYMCIGNNESGPGSDTCQRAARAIAHALEDISSTSSSTGFTRPTVLVLRSYALNPDLAKHHPRIPHAAITFAFSHAMLDLEKSCAVYFHAQQQDLAHVIYVDPPAIHNPELKTGTGYRLILDDAQTAAINYADLGAAFIEIASRAEEYRGLGVGVTDAGNMAADWVPSIRQLLTHTGTRLWELF